MKKQFCTIISRNEKGFFLPYVVFIATIIFVAFSMTLYFYQVEYKITNNTVEQIKIDNVLRMAQKRFMEEKMYEKQETGEFLYDFPEGEVEVTFEYLTETRFIVRYWINVTEKTTLLYHNTIRLEEDY